MTRCPRTSVLDTRGFDRKEKGGKSNVRNHFDGRDPSIRSGDAAAQAAACRRWQDNLAQIVLRKNGDIVVAEVKVSKSKFGFHMGIRQLQDDFFGTYDFLVQKIKAVLS